MRDWGEMKEVRIEVGAMILGGIREDQEKGMKAVTF